MDNVIGKIDKFIFDYIKWSQERGPMYGTIEQLESNWSLLNKIYFIIHDIDGVFEKYSFSTFLMKMGYGARDVSTIIKEEGSNNPYFELNKLWNKYVEWRNFKFEEDGIVTKKA